MYVLCCWCSLLFVNWHLSEARWSWRWIAVVSAGPWFAISASLALIYLSALGTLLSNAMMFRLSWQVWQLVAKVRVMKEFVLPLFPVLTMSSGFVAVPIQFSMATFIVNDGDASLFVFLWLRRSAAVAAVVAVVAMNGIGWDVCVAAVLGAAVTGSWGSEGYAMAMISSTSFQAATPILSASAGLEIIWLIGFMLGVGYVWNLHCCL